MQPWWLPPNLPSLWDQGLGPKQRGELPQHKQLQPHVSCKKWQPLSSRQLEHQQQLRPPRLPAVHEVERGFQRSTRHTAATCHQGLSQTRESLPRSQNQKTQDSQRVAVGTTCTGVTIFKNRWGKWLATYGVLGPAKAELRRIQRAASLATFKCLAFPRPSG